MKLIIGICTISTRAENSLPATLQSLIDNSTEEDRRQFRIIVQDGDRDVGDSAQMVQVMRAFAEHLRNGLLTIVEARPTDYTDFENSILESRESRERILWRSKQWIHFELMFECCSGMAEFYLHLEDHVTCADLRHLATDWFGRFPWLVSRLKDQSIGRRDPLLAA